MGGITLQQMEVILMAAGATVCEIAADATDTTLPLAQVLVAGDFTDGRAYLPPGWNGSTSEPTPGTWTAITGQSADPTTGTAILTVASLGSKPVAGIRVYLRGPSQSITGTVTADQGKAGTTAWPVSEATLDDAAAAPGTAAPANAVQVGGTDGTDLRALATDASGRAQVTVATALPAGTAAIGSVAQGAAGTAPWLIGRRYAVVPGATADGTAVDAAANLFSAYYSAPSEGYVELTLEIASTGSAAVGQYTLDGGTTWWELRSGADLQPGQAGGWGIIVGSGQSFGVSFKTATTLGHVEARFVYL